ncbi:hypothetical protein QOZ80_8BG0644510 [Eleusine coracana subsp. coracana]|nr:hypothetical protein QOZ80_8BG0644510 [Eleusine coracana subsp. coracana]
MASMVLAMLVSLVTALFASGDGDSSCPGIRSMTLNETCLAACGPTNPQLYSLCLETLQNDEPPAAGKKAAITVFVVAAARRVARAYDDTVDEAERLIVAGALTRDEREVYQRCIGSYGLARAEIGGVVSDVAGCEFGRVREEYEVAEKAVAACGEALMPGSPLAAKNASDRDLTAVAADLGALVLRANE